MPSFNKSKYTTVQTQEFTMRALGVLSDSTCPLTIEEICNRDTCLVQVTQQKMARVLSDLCEAGFVKKAKSKAKGRMVYGVIQTKME